MLNTYLMTAVAKALTKTQAAPELLERARSLSTAGLAGRVVIKALIFSALLAVSLSGAVHDVMSDLAVNQGLLFGTLIAAFIISDRTYWPKPSD